MSESILCGDLGGRRVNVCKERAWRQMGRGAELQGLVVSFFRMFFECFRQTTTFFTQSVFECSET